VVAEPLGHPNYANDGLSHQKKSQHMEDNDGQEIEPRRLIMDHTLYDEFQDTHPYGRYQKDKQRMPDYESLNSHQYSSHRICFFSTLLFYFAE